jgi:hypothetical protein
MNATGNRAQIRLLADDPIACRARSQIAAHGNPSVGRSEQKPLLSVATMRVFAAS